MGENDADQIPAEQAEPWEPQTTSAEQFDISDIQPLDAEQRARQNAEETVQPVVETAQEFNPEAEHAAAQEAILNSDISRTNLPPAAGEAEPTKQLYVGNLFFDVTEDDLRREFSRHGTVTNVRVVYDARGLSKGLVLSWALFVDISVW